MLGLICNIMNCVLGFAFCTCLLAQAQDISSALATYDTVDLFNNLSMPQFNSRNDLGWGPPDFGDDQSAADWKSHHSKKRITWRTLSTRGGQPTLLVVGDSIDLGAWADYVLLGDRDKPNSRPANLVVIANELRVSRPIVLFADGGINGPQGTNVTLITQRLSLNAPLDLHSVGDFAGSGKGGDITVVATTIEVKGVARELKSIAKGGTLSPLNIYNGGSNGGAPGSILLLQQASDIDALGHDRELSIWRIHWLEYLNYKLRDNFTKKTDYQGTANLISRYRDLPGWPVEDIFRLQISDLLDRLEKYLGGLAVVSWPLSVQPDDGAPRQLQVFFELATLETRIAPTEALVIPRTVSGRTVLGVVRPVSNVGDQLELAFDVELTLDPLLRSLAAHRLAPMGQIVTGAFANWQIDPPQLKSQGIVRSSIVPSGMTLQVTLDLDADAGTLALWRLSSVGGLPLILDYKCTGDRSVHGQLPIALSLTRRDRSEVTATNGLVTNASDKDVSISYVLVNGDAITLRPALGVRAKETVSLNLGNGPVDGPSAGFEIPPAAVTYTGADPVSLADFDSTLGSGLIQKVEVENLLRPHNSVLNLDLEYTEITVTYSVAGSAEAIRLLAGPFKLAPFGSDGANVTVPFIRPKGATYSFEIQGVAVYDKGRSRLPFKVMPTSDLSIVIDEGLLPQLSAK
jgi:hypothetical protein